LSATRGCSTTSAAAAAAAATTTAGARQRNRGKGKPRRKRGLRAFISLSLPVLGTSDSQLHEPGAILDDFGGCFEIGFLLEG